MLRFVPAVIPVRDDEKVSFLRSSKNIDLFYSLLLIHDTGIKKDIAVASSRPLNPNVHDRAGERITEQL
jgi:hypothetical protein